MYSPYIHKQEPNGDDASPHQELVHHPFLAPVVHGREAGIVNRLGVDMRSYSSTLRSFAEAYKSKRLVREQKWRRWTLSKAARPGATSRSTGKLTSTSDDFIPVEHSGIAGRNGW